MLGMLIWSILLQCLVVYVAAVWSIIIASVIDVQPDDDWWNLASWLVIRYKRRRDRRNPTT